MMKKIKNQQGFTLIELIIVIAVIAILAAVLLPRFLGFTEDAKFSAAKSEGKNIATAAEAIAAQGNTFSTGDNTDEKVFSPGEVMGYLGKQLKGSLTFVESSGELQNFTYSRNDGTNSYPVTYYVNGTSQGSIVLGNKTSSLAAITTMIP